MTRKGKFTEPIYYQSYLIRLWRESGAGSWRILVVYVPTGERHFFANLSEALAFLERRARFWERRAQAVSDHNQG
jgi:hypothetical protein